MRWFRIRKAKIDPALRVSFERMGVPTLQSMLAAPGSVISVKVGSDRRRLSNTDELLPWLTEQYDRAERKETWSLTMEAGIVILIVFEIVLAIIK